MENFETPLNNLNARYRETSFQKIFHQATKNERIKNERIKKSSDFADGSFITSVFIGREVICRHYDEQAYCGA